MPNITNKMGRAKQRTTKLNPSEATFEAQKRATESDTKADERDFCHDAATFETQKKATDSDLEITAEVSAFEQWLKADKQQYYWVAKTSLFLIVVLLFPLMFGGELSWYSLLILLGVLMLHESGHLLGMRLFGYRDLSLLLIPPLGKAIPANKATSAQRLMIYLLGPLPGLTLSFVVLGITDNPLWFEIGVIAFAFNYLSLLPMKPYDGGYIMETLQRIRFLSFLFVVASILILTWGVWLVKSAILTLLILLLSLSLALQWRWSQVAAQIAKTLPRDADRQTRLRAILQVLRQPPFHRKTIAMRFDMANNLLQYLAQSVPTVKLSVVGGMIYFVVLATPVYLAYSLPGWTKSDPFVALFNRGTTSCRYREPEPNWDAQLSQAESEIARWEIFMAAGNWQLEATNYRRAYQYYQRALSIAEQFPQTDERVIDTLIQLAASANNTKKTQQYYTKALSLLEQHHSPNHPRIADIFDQLVWAPNITATEQIERLKTALRIRAQHGLSQTAKNAATWKRLADFYRHVERLAEAEHSLQRSLSIYQSLSAKQYPSYLLSGVIHSLATLYLNQQRPQQAQHFLQKHLVTPQNHFSETETARLFSLLGWAYLGQDKLAEAQEAIKQSLTLLQQQCGRCNGATLAYWLDLAYIELRSQDFSAFNQHFAEIEQTYTEYYQSTLTEYAHQLQTTLQQTASKVSTRHLITRTKAHLEVLQYAPPKKVI